MDLTLSRYHQSRLDFISGLKAFGGLSADTEGARQLRALGQEEQLEAELNRTENGQGSLTLDPGMAVPSYFPDTKFHLQPGGLWRDMLTTPIYETGVAHFVQLVSGSLAAAEA